MPHASDHNLKRSAYQLKGYQALSRRKTTIQVNSIERFEVHLL